MASPPVTARFPEPHHAQDDLQLHSSLIRVPSDNQPSLLSFPYFPTMFGHLLEMAAHRLPVTHAGDFNLDVLAKIGRSV